MEDNILSFVARMGEVNLNQIMDEFYLDDHSQALTKVTLLVKKNLLSVRKESVGRKKNIYSITQDGRMKIRVMEQNEHFRV